ncbi:hypothetical protein NKR23_g11472 [Pleurostoma richardsiae]|uniref:Uncharacterized protein n=1 Tax=Pleurostoma richardsiae TaxID=41990 RepID=A0AA38R1B7_9PEZI|nr:hypothetical protein NKR23_g11472 [Pleurostoma richardsiae]
MRGLPLHDEPRSAPRVSRWNCFGGLFQYWRPRSSNPDPTAEEPPVLREELIVFEKRYVHVPSHAASSFMQTATSRDMKKANEVLV